MIQPINAPATQERSRSPITDRQIEGKRSWFNPPKVIDDSFIDPKPSIVLAEDDDVLREMFAEVLKNRGCNVRCATDGNAAWRLLREAPFALLITDYDMPGLTGLELVRKMRTESLHQPAILISGNMPWNKPDFYELLSPGAAIEKPFTISKLIAVMCGLIIFQSNTNRTAPRQASA
jgi:DNA-binding response OmpR family regulator